MFFYVICGPKFNVSNLLGEPLLKKDINLGFLNYFEIISKTIYGWIKQINQADFIYKATFPLSV